MGGNFFLLSVQPFFRDNFIFFSRFYRRNLARIFELNAFRRSSSPTWTFLSLSLPLSRLLFPFLWRNKREKEKAPSIRKKKERFTIFSSLFSYLDEIFYGFFAHFNISLTWNNLRLTVPRRGSHLNIVLKCLKPQCCKWKIRLFCTFEIKLNWSLPLLELECWKFSLRRFYAFVRSGEKRKEQQKKLMSNNTILRFSKAPLCRPRVRVFFLVRRIYDEKRRSEWTTT